MICGPFKPLALRKDLIQTNKKGTIISSNGISIKYLYKEENKMAFIVRKKLGCAVLRNRVKRRIRNIIENFNQINLESSPIHCVIIVKPEGFEYSFYKLKYEIEELFGKITKQNINE